MTENPSSPHLEDPLLALELRDSVRVARDRPARLVVELVDRVAVHRARRCIDHSADAGPLGEIREIRRHGCVATKFMAGSNSAMGSFDRPARKITWSYPARSSTPHRRTSLSTTETSVRKVDAEPLQVDDVRPRTRVRGARGREQSRRSPHLRGSGSSSRAPDAARPRPGLEVLRERVLPARHVLEPARTERRVDQVRALGADRRSSGRSRWPPQSPSSRAGELEDASSRTRTRSSRRGSSCGRGRTSSVRRRCACSRRGDGPGRRHAELRRPSARPAPPPASASDRRSYWPLPRGPVSPNRLCVRTTNVCSCALERSLLPLELALAVPVERIRRILLACNRRLRAIEDVVGAHRHELRARSPRIAAARLSTPVGVDRTASSGFSSHPARSWNAAQFTTASGRSRATSAGRRVSVRSACSRSPAGHPRRAR